MKLDCEDKKYMCDIIDECRCYAYNDSKSPKGEQVCGIKKHGSIHPCKPGCCPGGCSGQCKDVPDREPYGTGEKFEVPRLDVIFKICMVIILGLVIISTLST